MNIHRHGIVDESQVDFYVFRLDGQPVYFFGKAAIYLIIPAPLNMKTAVISPRSLLNHWSKFCDRVDLIRDAARKQCIAEMEAFQSTPDQPAA